MPETKPVNIFIAYAHADEAFLRPLRKHLEVLEDDGVFIWYDGEILPGEEWDASIKKRLKEAHIILLLVSIDFLTSDYVKGTELPTALSRHASGECKVVPVIVRNCLWQKKLGALQALPKEAFPVENWSSRDSAYHNVVEGLDRVIEEIKKLRLTAQVEKPAQAQRDADRFLQNDKKSDLFHDLMVYVKGGDFEMGGKYRTEKPIHRVTVHDFHICKFPVTQGQWKQIIDENPALFTGDDNRPVEQVSWDDAGEFIKTLNRMTNKRYRLPSEAEWEYAARGGSQSEGFKYAGSNNVDEVAWHEKNSGGTTHPVGLKKPNELGLYDMSGNVWEWCEDIWHNNYKRAPIDGSAWTAGMHQDSSRCLRGGSWRYGFTMHLKSSGRYLNSQSSRKDYFGFRLAHDYPM